MSFDLRDTFEILERTPSVLAALLRGLGASWTTVNEGPDTWNAFDILGHLIHGEETDWIPRATLILERGEERPFEAFDRFAQFQRFKGWTVDRLLETFTEQRAANLGTVRGWRLTDEQLARTGQHPALGRVTLQQLFATWVVHDLGHLAQAARVMAKRYGDEVGPWREYLPVLTR